MSSRGEDDLILTIPNIISAIRLVGVGFFAWLVFVDREFAAAGWLLLVIGGTDWVDGYLARRLRQVSELGKVLDPLADRLAIITAVVGGMVVGVIPLLLGLGIAIRDVAVGAAGLVLLGEGRRIDVRRLGKVATFVLYGAVPAFYVAQGTFASRAFLVLGWSLGVVGLVLYWWAAFQYLGDLRSRR